MLQFIQDIIRVIRADGLAYDPESGELHPVKVTPHGVKFLVDISDTDYRNAEWYTDAGSMDGSITHIDNLGGLFEEPDQNEGENE